ncbi:DUF5362 family protein [Fervidibacillus halotolerans]|uniref:DUF5362 family protein n=1 Tax=Fervidibacillus halotolerans TaxID=2980027 RepID=A0A9E8LZ43_9BACI|nr:DUF5362 family protein [Fervidibacillus halotolerans]WAA12478.1 DUF5362 family protein [Fervidibacillus halotolerans]
MNEQLLAKRLSQISLWGKFAGIVSFILGGLAAVFGFFFFIVGAIPGILLIVIGYFQLKTGQNAGKLKENPDESVQLALFDHLGKQYIIQTIAQIIVVIFIIIFLIFVFASIIMFPDIINDYYNEIDPNF